MKKERDDSEGEKRAELERVEVLVKELLNEAGDRERERESERGSERRMSADYLSDCAIESQRAVRERAEVLVEERLVGADDFGSARGSERRESADHVKKERDDSEGEKRAELEREKALVKELLNEAGDLE